MKIIKYLSLATLLTSALLTSCKHDNFDQLGPDFCSSLVDPFSRNTKDNDSLNFSLNSDTLKSKISGNLNWDIVIRGRSSKAVKRYSGESSDIAQLWNGESDTLAFFQKGEYVDYSFSSNCQPNQFKSAYLKNIPNYAKFGYLLWDYETPVNSNYAIQAATDGTIVYGGLDSTSFPIIQGRRWGRIAGTPSAWYMGQFLFSFLTNKINTKLVETNPNNIYLNFFVNANGSQTNSPAVVFTERVSGKTVSKQAKFSASGTGWQFVSINLGKDASIVNPSQVSTISISVGPLTSGAPCDLSVDFVILTKGKPLQ